MMAGATYLRLSEAGPRDAPAVPFREPRTLAIPPEETDLARAKNTNRAEARRRTREQQRALDAAEAGEATIEEVAPPIAVNTGGGSLLSGFRIPNLAADLRAFPHMLLHTPKLWIPFGILLASFVMAMLLPVSKMVSYGPGMVTEVLGSSIIPSGLDRMAALFVQLTLPPTALFVFFIGGFLAPRASYLVGALLGLVDGILWSIYVFSTGGSQEGFQAGTISDVLAIIGIAMLIGIIAAGFAAWYRAFLRSSQERARQNRIAREQQMRAKAKEQERVAKEEQRQAAIAAREAQRAERAAAQAAKSKPTGSSAPSASTGAPPTSGKA